MVASYPNYVHGNIDPVENLGLICRDKCIGLHVDAGIGGMLAMFETGHKFNQFDFRVVGVTSLSVDFHKHGLGVKGSSIVLFKSRKLRNECVFSISTWPGGLYASNSIYGSRTGVAGASAWFTLVHHGRDRLTQSAREIIEATQALVDDLRKLHQVEVVGEPRMCMVAIKSRKKLVDIKKLHQLMFAKGWRLGLNKVPCSLLLEVTHANRPNLALFVQDLKDCISQVTTLPIHPLGHPTQGQVCALWHTARGPPGSQRLPTRNESHEFRTQDMI